MVHRVESPQNKHFKKWLSLLDPRGIRKQGQYLLMGRTLVNEALAQQPEVFSEVLIKSGDNPSLWPSHLKVMELTPQLFREIDIFGTDFPILVAKLSPMKSIDLASDPQGLEVLCGLGDPSNVGALIRSCEAFAVTRIILLQSCAHPFHPKSLRASSGSVLRAPLFQGPSIQSLKPPLVALDASGAPLQDFTWPQNIRILIGEEGPGLPDTWRNSSNGVQIPMASNIESLNATVAASIALYSYRVQHPLR